MTSPLGHSCCTGTGRSCERMSFTNPDNSTEIKLPVVVSGTDPFTGGWGGVGSVAFHIQCAFSLTGLRNHIVEYSFVALYEYGNKIELVSF